MKIFSKIAFLICLMCYCATCHSQDLDYVPGELIIQMQPDLVDKGQKLSLSPVLSDEYVISEALFPSKGVYLIRFDKSKSIDLAMEELALVEDILYVQKNQLVYPRTTEPNDPLFGDQWYHNTIKSNLAWDITTGGTDSRGREIVVAIMDSGFDTSHEDFAGNIWQNPGEIPNDNIDNDANGYTDDYTGWNFDASNDNHSNSGQGTLHGSNVAGMAGARGDNGQGVTGVAWDVKLMFLSGLRSSTEIVSAMNYATAMRRAYNESDGAEGAFIVSSNISLGIRNGLAEDFPIWCEMYDAMGEQGILNVSAVDNLDSDVELNGDMPTQCSSEFLITVTNTDINNIKDPEAAFGSVSVDMGAPGTDNIAVSPNNNYNTTSGTSVAAPLVAGAIALLYSAPCEIYANQSTSEPAAIALSMKNMIFAGLTPSSSLQGITTQEGVLNVFESIKALDRSCSEGDVVDNSISVTPTLLSRQSSEITVTYRAAEIAGTPILKIFDARGAEIFEDELEQTFFGSNSKLISIPNDLSSGIYFISLILPDKSTFTEKIIVD